MSFGTMVQQILTDVNRGSQHAPRVKQAIVDAISRFQNKRLGWNQKRQETSIQSGDEYIALPDDWLESAFVRLQDGTNRLKLVKRDWEWIEDHLTSDQTIGQPSDYAIQARELRLFPICDRSYSLVMLFQCKLPGISLSASDDASNAWLEEGDLLIRNWAMGEVLVKYIQGDSAPLGSSMILFAEGALLAEFEAQASRESSSGRIRARL